MSSARPPALKMTRHAPAEVGGHRPEPDQHAGEEVVLPARTILVAAGTQPNTVLAREEPEHIALDGRYFRALDEDGNPAEPERVAKPEAVRVLTSVHAGRARGQLLGRSAPELCRQCRQGDGRHQAGLSGDQPHARDARPRPARACRAEGAARPRIARPRASGRAADPDNHRGRRRGADGGARLPAGTVLSAAELRDAGAAHRRHDAGDGGAGADRRLGRSRARPVIDDRARNGRLVRSLRPAEAGRAGRADGADRNADRDPCRRDRAAGRRRARQRGAVLDRRGAARGRARACCISPATRRSSTATRSPISSAPPIRSSGAATRRPVSRRDGRRTCAFVGNIVAGDRGLWRGDARAGRYPARRGRPHHRDRLGRHDERGRRGAPRRAAAAISARITARSRRSTRRCSA